MKKGEELTLLVEDMDFPNRAYAMVEGQKVYIKNGFPGQEVRCRISKKRSKKIEARILEVEKRAKVEIPSPCPHFEECGGCSYQNIPYEEQLRMKEHVIQKLFQKHSLPMGEYEGILGSPKKTAYRNKMEFSFGDREKDGPLCLGMHRRESMYDIVNADFCQIVDEDFQKILTVTREYFGKKNKSYFHRNSHQGYLRHLVIRKAEATGEVMVNLVTTTEEKEDLTPYVNLLKEQTLQGVLASVVHTENDSLSDAVKPDMVHLLYGKWEIQEELLGLRFNISPFSFFQTNSKGAEVLYQKVQEYVGELGGKRVFDLYSGTGTIAQLMAPVAKEVIAIEIVEEAVEKAKENATLNGIENCNFIAGDVLAKVEELGVRPEVIVLDPPRAGIHPKAIQKIISYQPEVFVYVSCKASSLVEDLPHFLEAGYEVKKSCLVDMFVGTPHVETVVKLQRQNP